MAVEIMIQFNGKQLTIPINPEELEITREADNDDIEIIGLGKTTRKGEPGLITATIDSFFPAPNTYHYTGVKPKTCIEFINEIWNTENINNKVARIITTGLPVNLNMYFVIESFNYNNKAGEEDDIYYELEIKQYKPYGVKTVTNSVSGLLASRTVSTTNKTSQNQTTNSTQKRYTVIRGDCLWNITKKYTGSGARWKELYDINKQVVGNNPNLIYPGQVLTLPVGW